MWILGTQIGMMATLLLAMPLNLATEIGLLTLIILLHNAFSATQDVAIDALAVGVLPEHERGVANGFMFAGASVGQAIGGSGVLFLAAVMPFGMTYWFVIAAIHGLEASFNFRAHFHNGDFPLTARTRQVPAGRPAVWLPPTLESTEPV